MFERGVLAVAVLETWPGGAWGVTAGICCRSSLAAPSPPSPSELRDICCPWPAPLRCLGLQLYSVRQTVSKSVARAYCKWPGKKHFCWKPVENLFLSRGSLWEEDGPVKLRSKCLHLVIAEVSYSRGMKKKFPQKLVHWAWLRKDDSAMAGWSGWFGSGAEATARDLSTLRDEWVTLSRLQMGSRGNNRK